MADFVVGDSESKLVARLIRRDGSLVDLTGKSVNLKFRIGSVTHAAVGMTVLSPPTAARAEYKFSSADLSEEGIMYAEVEVVG